MKLLTNRGSYLTAALLILAGVAVATGLVAPEQLGGLTEGITYEQADQTPPVGGTSDGRGLGLIGVLLGALGIRQRIAVARTQGQNEEILALLRKGQDGGK